LRHERPAGAADERIMEGRPNELRKRVKDDVLSGIALARPGSPPAELVLPS